MLHGTHVVLPAGGTVCLALIGLRHGRGMNDVRGPFAGQHLLQLGGIAYVEGHERQPRIQAGQLVGAARGGYQLHPGFGPQASYQLLAQQAVGAGEENFHAEKGKSEWPE